VAEQPLLQLALDAEPVDERDADAADREPFHQLERAGT
jgi:hypothetical protein